MGISNRSAPAEPLTAHVSPAILAQQMASITDRVIDSVGNNPFKLATAIPAVSPVLNQARAGDLVVSYNAMLDPLAPDVTAVVLKPRASATVYQIPTPNSGTNLYNFLHANLQQAVAQGAGTIRFPPTYDFQLRPPIPFEDQPSGPIEQEAYLNLSGLHDLTIDLNGSTIDLLDRVVGIRVEDSSRIVIKNGTIRGQGLLSSIGTVRPDTTLAGIRAAMSSPSSKHRWQRPGQGHRHSERSAAPNLGSMAAGESRPTDMPKCLRIGGCLTTISSIAMVNTLPPAVYWITRIRL